MKSVKDKIRERIERKGRGWVFTAQDFMPVFRRYEIDTSLKTLSDQGVIRKVCRGMYDYPAYSALLQQTAAPDLYSVAKKFAEKYRWTIAPSGDTALNYFGLSTQIPSRLVFASNGPSKELATPFGVISFRHSAMRETSFRYVESALLVQALREIGQDALTPETIARFKEKLPESLLPKIQRDIICAPNWMQQIML